MRAERFIIMLFLISIAMRLLHIQGAEGIMIVALGGLALMYLLFGWYFFSTDGIRNQSLLMSIIAGILLAIAPVGILFRLLYWQGGKMQVMFGAMFALITFFVTLLLKTTSETQRLQPYYKNMLVRSAVLFVICTGLFFTTRTQLIKMEHWNDPRMGELKARCYRQPDNVQARRDYEQYLRSSKQ